jgi:hypothetical protein
MHYVCIHAFAVCCAVNALDTEWGWDDLEAIAGLKRVDAIALPKVCIHVHTLCSVCFYQYSLEQVGACITVCKHEQCSIASIIPVKLQ